MATSMVTGGTSGIGREFVTQLAARGDAIVLVAAGSQLGDEFAADAGCSARDHARCHTVQSTALRGWSPSSQRLSSAFRHNERRTVATSWHSIDMTKWIIGGHVDTADAVAQAAARGADIAQISLGDPKSWKKPVCDFPGGSLALREAAGEAGLTLVVHSAFVIN